MLFERVVAADTRRPVVCRDGGRHDDAANGDDEKREVIVSLDALRQSASRYSCSLRNSSSDGTRAQRL
jgi:hypothetical protein